MSFEGNFDNFCPFPAIGRYPYPFGAFRNNPQNMNNKMLGCTYAFNSIINDDLFSCDCDENTSNEM